MATPVSPNNMRNEQIRWAIRDFFNGKGTAQSAADSLNMTVDEFMAEVEKQNQRIANAHGALAKSISGSVQ